jgi:hypothetical protein
MNRTPLHVIMSLTGEEECGCGHPFTEHMPDGDGTEYECRWCSRATAHPLLFGTDVCILDQWGYGVDPFPDAMEVTFED